MSALEGIADELGEAEHVADVPIADGGYPPAGLVMAR
jgi:hypothetical protein